MSRGNWDRRKDDPQARHNQPIKPKAKKDTKRWCRGKVGVEHEPIVRKRAGYWHDKPCRGSVVSLDWLACNHEEACVNCGKILKWALGKDCPERKDAEG